MKSILKWTLRIVLGIVALLVIAGFTMVMIGGSQAKKTYASVDGLLSSVSSDSLALARGEHLAKTLACHHCHTDNLSGAIMGDAPPFLLTSSNLTRGSGSAIANYSVADWDRAIRHGIKPDGSRLLIMPSKSYHKLSDEDAAYLIAYLQTIPAVDNEVPRAQLKPLGKALLVTGAQFYETELTPTNVAAVPSGPSLDYGTYLASITCKGCHGQSFEGGPGPDPNVPAPSLQSAAQWDYEDFASTLRTGVKPNGDTLSASMPFVAFENFTDDEVSAIYQYIQHSFE